MNFQGNSTTKIVNHEEDFALFDQVGNECLTPLVPIPMDENKTHRGISKNGEAPQVEEKSQIKTKVVETFVEEQREVEVNVVQLRSLNCNIPDHKMVRTVKHEHAYLCTHCLAISMRRQSALAHYRRRSTKTNECPESKWPSKYRYGFEEYTRLRKNLDDDLKRGVRTMSVHRKMRNKLMHPYILS